MRCTNIQIKQGAFRLRYISQCISCQKQEIGGVNLFGLFKDLHWNTLDTKTYYTTSIYINQF